MADDQRDELIDKTVYGGRTVRENLARAVDAGKLRVTPGGQWALPPAVKPVWDLIIRRLPDKRCQVYNAFMFHHAYVGATVPHGCRACFKVKIVPSTLRGLVALRDMLEPMTDWCKCGIDFYNPHSRDFYAAFLYYEGLDAARDGYRDMRARVDAHPLLGPSTPMTIKRGCSNYEAACGPSDRWNFPDGMEELESELDARFQRPTANVDSYRLRRMTAMVHWIKFAYWIKDDSYLDFTGGKPLHPPTVSYPP